MKSVIISTQPKWVEKIVNGEKTIEVRKTRPKIDTPFKCYIYVTKDKPYLYRVDDDNNFELTNTLHPKVDGYVKDYNEQNGKIIGVFVCDRIDISVVEFKPNDIEPCYWKLINGSCLTKNELMNYGKYNALYGWHISDLKIYDKPKMLGEFKNLKGESIKNAYQSWGYINE